MATLSGLSVPPLFTACEFWQMAMNCVDARSFAYMNTGGAKAEEAFNWLFNISSVTGLIAWA